MSGALSVTSVPLRPQMTEAPVAAGALISQFGGEVLHRSQAFPHYPQRNATFWLYRWGLVLEAV